MGGRTLRKEVISMGLIAIILLVALWIYIGASMISIGISGASVLILFVISVLAGFGTIRDSYEMVLDCKDDCLWRLQLYENDRLADDYETYLAVKKSIDFYNKERSRFSRDWLPAGWLKLEKIQYPDGLLEDIERLK